MPYRQHRLERERLPPNAITTTSPAPPIVVECWCGLVSGMDRPSLDRFTCDIWKRFDHTDLEPLKRAILRRREELAAEPARKPYREP